LLGIFSSWCVKDPLHFSRIFFSLFTFDRSLLSSLEFFNEKIQEPFKAKDCLKIAHVNVWIMPKIRFLALDWAVFLTLFKSLTFEGQRLHDKTLNGSWFQFFSLSEMFLSSFSWAAHIAHKLLMNAHLRKCMQNLQEITKCQYQKWSLSVSAHKIKRALFSGDMAWSTKQFFFFQTS